jgi:predicted glutamine amidotransferase
MMIYTADEDIVLRHVHFQLGHEVEAKVLPNPDGWGIDFMADDSTLSFTITFTPAYKDLLRDLLAGLEEIDE